MKKLFIVLLLLPLFMGAQPVTTITPQNGKVLWNFDLSSISGTDTSFTFKFPGQQNSIVRSWSTHVKWVDIDTTGWGERDTIGFVRLEVSNYEKTDFISYADSLSVRINDTTGSAGVEDVMWNWKYGRWFITFVDTVQGGKLWIDTEYQPE